MPRFPAHARVLGILPDLVDALEQRASPSTVRQRLWAINQAVEHQALRTTGRSDINTLTRVRLDELLDPDAVTEYLAAAEAGRLRLRAPATDRARPESPRSTAARAAALRWLADQTDLTPPPPLPQDTTLIDPSAALAQQLKLAVTAWTETDYPTLVRAAAAAVVVASTAATSTRLAALQLEDVTAGDGGFTLPAHPLDPRPHNFSDEANADATVRARVLPWGAPALKVWLTHRQRIIARLEGSDPGALFVTCHANNLHLPPGMALSVRGLTAAHTAAVRRLEDLEPQMDPPRTLSTVRRVALANLLGPA